MRENLLVAEMVSLKAGSQLSIAVVKQSSSTNWALRMALCFTNEGDLM